jgi:arylsulfatase A
MSILDGPPNEKPIRSTDLGESILVEQLSWPSTCVFGQATSVEHPTMNTHSVSRWIVLCCFFGAWIGNTQAADRPNIVLIFADDQGYGDLGVYGAQGYETPNLDRMAAEGLKFTSFYVSQAVCGASRASLLTGCYSNRVSILGAPGPNSKIGINSQEQLLPELLKQEGYATAMFGKWHLGHLQPFLPPNHGFDEYFGLPYSNDMWPYHPTSKAFPDLPLIEGTKTINPSVTAEDQTHLTRWYTERAVKFIKSHRDEPFFLYVAHAMPHVPLFCSEKFQGSSQQGAYGDVIQEIDWGVGQILSTLDECGIADNTLVIYTSDNGPWLSYGNHAGTTAGLREGKGTAWEGGVRVPCLMRWPGQLDKNRVVDQMAATIDIVPTLCELAGVEKPRNKIDGVSLVTLLKDASAAPPRDTYHYYYGQELRAVRQGPWKLVFPHQFRSLTGEPGQDGLPAGYSQQKCELGLYHLESDRNETKNVASDHPEIVQQLQELAEAMRAQLGDSLTQTQGMEIRPPGRLNESP